MFIVPQGAECLSSCQEACGTEEQGEWPLCRNDLRFVWVMGKLRERGNLGMDKSGTDCRKKMTFSSCGS